MPRRRRNDPIWTIFSVLIIVFLLYAVLQQALTLGWYFLVLFLITLVLYIRQGKLHSLIENPGRIIILFVVQVVIFSLGSLLVEAKESLLKGSILTALILLGTYLYLRSEFSKLKDI